MPIQLQGFFEGSTCNFRSSLLQDRENPLQGPPTHRVSLVLKRGRSKRGRSKRGRTQKHAKAHKRAQMSAKERKRKSAH